MEGRKEKPKDIRKRSFEYALQAIKLHQSVQEGTDRAGWILGKQYLRAATSIGANIEEAQSGESKADFIHKMSIAQKEARESLYWLHLFEESEIILRDRLQPLIQETEEIIAILTAIIRKTKQNR
ncbi:four helix bundle protein [Oscillatoria sp. FACHB-1406]|uniref:four helix bundle protein n=1 Tax=Oscillatoria sp. FACHB-1406 TaxID=2692846 RepID=UPI0016888E7B|nr:four helix bundle protein [Oscillatoria sp. FACHB-1406]MBD2577391.1 four helix bundle protein [Oscillatoria sp. FACHB-1406]